MEIKSIKVIEGKNRWSESKDKLIHMVLDLGVYEKKPSNKIEGFYERIKEYLPSLKSHRCSEGRPGGFLKRIKDGTWMGHIVEHVALELQSLAGYDTGWGRTRGVEGQKGVYNVVFNYENKEFGKLAAKEAVNVVKDIINDRDPQIDKIVKKLKPKTLQESIRRILKEERNISDIIKIAAKEYNCSTWEINNGYCEDFALNVLEKLGGYEDNLFELSGDMFFNQRDPEFAKENWGDVIETNYGVWSKNLLDYWGYPPNVNLNLVDDEINHVWLFYNGKHYDAEVPEGVDNWFEIPLIKRLFNRYKKNMVQESIRRILKEETDPKKEGLLNIIQEDGLYNFTKDTGLSYNDIYHRIGELPSEVKIQYLKDVVDDLQQFPGELDLTFITGSIPLYENDDWQMVYAEYLNNEDNVLRVHLTTFIDDNRDEYDTIHEDDIDYETLETLVSELSEKLQHNRN